MISSEKLEDLINNYQLELQELYSLLKTLENPIFLKKYNSQNVDLSEVKNNIEFLLFFISSFLDILISLKVLFITEIDWERKFHIKNGLLSVYECIKTFNKHQKEIRILLDSNHDLKEEYNIISVKIREYKKKYNYDTRISNFRNKAGAHYDENFIVYIESLESIDKPIYLIAIKEFADILDELLSFWQKLIDTLFEKINII